MACCHVLMIPCNAKHMPSVLIFSVVPIGSPWGRWGGHVHSNTNTRTHGKCMACLLRAMAMWLYICIATGAGDKPASPRWKSPANGRAARAWARVGVAMGMHGDERAPF